MKTAIFLLSTVFALLSTSSLYAQDSKYDRIYPFDADKFNEQFQYQNELGLDYSPKIQQDSALLSRSKQSNMPMLEVQKGHSSYNMPTMEIRNDIQYTMPIKKYDLCYPYVPQDRIDSILNLRKKRLIPLNPE